MIVPYTELPLGAGGSPRPVLDVTLSDMEAVGVPCLVDSGSLHTLLPGWLAAEAGLDLGGAERRSLGVAGSGTHAHLVTTALTLGGHRWEAEIGFCEPWPYVWGLLGQDSFFRFFTVTFRAVEFELEVEPISR